MFTLRSVFPLEGTGVVFAFCRGLSLPFLIVIIDKVIMLHYGRFLYSHLLYVGCGIQQKGLRAVAGVKTLSVPPQYAPFGLRIVLG